MKPLQRDALLVALFWSVATAVILAGRPLISPDETRYLDVAWEMWSRGNFLVPHLNGLPYSDKPPLLFWLFHLGWAVGGVSETWPRLIGPTAALASAFLLVPIARLLWPERRQAGWAATIALPGVLGWIIYGDLVLFDMLLTVAVLVALLGVLTAWRRPGLRGWLLCGLGVGLGFFAKGPVTLFHVLPVPLLAPWWMRDHRPVSWRRWYGGLALALLIGIVMVLIWAVPAAMAGGDAYRDAIFLRQTADRLVSGAAHGRPVWWYLPVIPALLVPWVLWAPAWRAIAVTRKHLTDSGVRLLLAWLAVTFVAFALTSGKQAHYLLPLMPALALLWARGWSESGPANSYTRIPGPVLLMVLGGLAVVMAPHLSGLQGVHPWVDGIRLWPGFVLLVTAGGMVVVARWSSALRGPLLVTSAGLCFVTLMGVALMPAISRQFDVTPLAMQLRAYQRQGYAVAHIGKYNGQWHFAARMTEPFTVLPNPTAAREWMAEHPRHVLISYARLAQGDARAAAGDQCTPFRDRLVCLTVGGPDETGGQTR